HNLQGAIREAHRRGPNAWRAAWAAAQRRRRSSLTQGWQNMDGSMDRSMDRSTDRRSTVTTLEDIKKTIVQLSADIEQLPADDLARLREWLDVFGGRLLDGGTRPGAEAGRHAGLAKPAVEPLA